MSCWHSYNMKKLQEIPFLRFVNRLAFGLPKKILWAFSEKIKDEIRGRAVFFLRAFKALSFNGTSGDYVEFGCSGALTFTLAYRKSRKLGMRMKMWAFDSFCGLPAPKDEKDEHPKWAENAMRMGVAAFRKSCRKGGIPAQAYSIVPGFYEKSLADKYETRLPRDICLAYIDCDLYSSTLTVLSFLAKRLKHGMVLAFDDYYCWSATQPSGERNAVREYFRDNKNWVLVPYMQFGWHGMSFVVEDRRLNGAASICY